MTKKILLVDDELGIISILKNYFRIEGYQVYTAINGTEALKKASVNPDIILLDINMPEIDGLTVCERIREQISCPILFLTARIETNDKIKGFSVGADDYIVKPFSPNEVMARVKAIMRRIDKEEKSDLVKYDNLEVNLKIYTALIDNNNVDLTKKEFEILWTLISNKNMVFSREKLLDAVWGYDYYGDSRTVDSHIKRLRFKLEKFGDQNWGIKTIWGVGYKFEGDK